MGWHPVTPTGDAWSLLWLVRGKLQSVGMVLVESRGGYHGWSQGRLGRTFHSMSDAAGFVEEGAAFIVARRRSRRTGS